MARRTAVSHRQERAPRGYVPAGWPLVAVLAIQAFLSLRLVRTNTAFQVRHCTCGPATSSGRTGSMARRSRRSRPTRPRRDGGLGPVVGGALAQFAGRPLVLCYLVEIVLLVPAIGVAATLPRALGATGQRWSPRRPRIPASIRRPFIIPAAVSCIAWSIAYVVLTLVPSYAAASLGHSNLLIEGGASGSLLLCAAVVQVLLRSWQARPAQAVGLALLVIGVLGLIAAGTLGSAAVLFATIAIAGAGQGVGFMGSLRRLSEIAPAAHRAETVAMFYVVTYIGGGISTVGVGLLATRLTLTASVQVFAAVFAAFALMTLGALLAGRGGARQDMPPSSAR